jgi:hypothetical protein
MTSLAQLPPRGTQMARALGNRVKLLSRKSAASPALNSPRLAKPAPNPEEESSRTRAHFHAKAVTSARLDSGGETPPKTTSFGEQYSRHLVDVKCITLHIVFYAFPARTKRVTLFGFPDFEFSGLDEASEYQCHLFRKPCVNTLFAIRSCALRRAPANESPLRSRPATQSLKVGPPFGL